MPATFTVSFEADPVQLVQRAKQVAAQNHVQFTGDEHSGHFSGDGVEGSYRVKDHTLSVTIDSKPFYVTMSMIETHVRQFFAV
jgi:hypothetical protein